ncbi:MAG: class I SAM-dependent methyltransferase [Candidatus Micrarchaeota archaeon]|nr:class I SAM-dependent methyltransferase [Candidatus Micrarchaeota archaeon]
MGCGEGSILKTLKDKTFCMGLDVSKTTLSYLRGHKIQGDATRLPFKDLSFDVVSALEVLEQHLKCDAF